MFRLAPLLVTAAAVSDETSLMQGVKPQHMSVKEEEKSKSVSSLLETAKTMLKNGATEDVVTFAEATLTQITDTVYPQIIASHEADQLLVDQTHKMFPDAIQELDEGLAQIVALRATEVAKGVLHRDCRGTVADSSIDKLDDPLCLTEYCACERKRGCDYELWAIWKHFAFEESDLRFKSDEIKDHFCPVGANGTTWVFRDYAVAKFPRWTVQKGVVEELEVDYDSKRSQCVTLYEKMDDTTNDCDAKGEDLEKASCELAQKQREVANRFAVFWTWAAETYQRVVDEVHCLEIDRWKEWRSLKTVACLLGRTKERNGRPCEESTDEYTSEVKVCEELQTTTGIDHLRITYPPVPPQPPMCEQPAHWAQIDVSSFPCIPVPVPIPCAPHSDYHADYVAAWHDGPWGSLWKPPVEEFHEPIGYTVDDHYQPITQTQHHERCGGTWERRNGKCYEARDTHLQEIEDGRFKAHQSEVECTCPDQDDSTAHWDALHKLREKGNSHCNPRPVCTPCTLVPEAPEVTPCQRNAWIEDTRTDQRNAGRASDDDADTSPWVRMPLQRGPKADVCMQATRDQMASGEGEFDAFGDGHFYNFETLPGNDRCVDANNQEANRCSCSSVTECLEACTNDDTCPGFAGAGNMGVYYTDNDQCGTFHAGAKMAKHLEIVGEASGAGTGSCYKKTSSHRLDPRRIYPKELVPEIPSEGVCPPFTEALITAADWHFGGTTGKGLTCNAVCASVGKVCNERSITLQTLVCSSDTMQHMWQFHPKAASNPLVDHLSQTDGNGCREYDGSPFYTANLAHRAFQNVKPGQNVAVHFCPDNIHTGSHSVCDANANNANVDVLCACQDAAGGLQD